MQDTHIEELSEAIEALLCKLENLIVERMKLRREEIAVCKDIDMVRSEVKELILTYEAEMNHPYTVTTVQGKVLGIV